MHTHMCIYIYILNTQTFIHLYTYKCILAHINIHMYIYLCIYLSKYLLLQSNSTRCSLVSPILMFLTSFFMSEKTASHYHQYIYTFSSSPGYTIINFKTANP